MAEIQRNNKPDKYSCIYDLLKARAACNPDAVAILAPDRAPLTYGRLLDQVTQSARQLRSLGIKKNDRIAIVLPNGPDMAAAFLSVASCATSAPLNPAYRESEFDFYLSDIDAKALIVQSGIDSPARTIASKRGIRIIELSPDPDSAAGVFSMSGDGENSSAEIDFAGPEDIALVLHTSGTTSRPKIVPLSQTSICSSARNIETTLELADSDRCLNVMPLFHIHGLMAAVMASIAAGASIVCTPGFYAPKFFEWMKNHRPTWYTAVPTMHQSILARAAQSPEIIASCPLRFLRSSSASLPPQVMAELEAAFGAPVIEAYGMTEAAHQMASNPLPPGKQKAGSVGFAAGPDVAVMDEAGTLLSSGKIGEIVIRGPSVMSGYENNPEADAAAFTNGWFRTGDQGYIEQDGYIFLTGRLKEIINRGGEKISPREIDEVLIDHPCVIQAVTFAVPDSRLGEDVGAALVLDKKQTPPTKREIREFAAKRLADFKIPRHVIFVEEIPKGPTGKLQRIGLAEKLGIESHDREPTGARPPYEAPGTPTEKALASIWEDILGLDKIGVRDDFIDLGGDSILAARMFGRIAKELGRVLTLGILFEESTLGGLASIIDEESWSPRWTSLVAIQPGGDKTPIFCVHPPPGNILGLGDLARCLGPDRPFYGLQSLGLDGGHAPLTTIEDMAAHYLDEVRAMRPEGPYILAGRSSTGALIAFEMAQLLFAQGVAPVSLILLDNPSPRGLWPEELKKPSHRDSLLRYPRRNIKRNMSALSAWSRCLFDSQSRRFSIINRVNLQANEMYKPKPYPGRIVLLMSKELNGNYRYDPHSSFGWETLAGGGLDYHVLEGTHEEFLKEPYVGGVAEKIASYLDAANGHD